MAAFEMEFPKDFLSQLLETEFEDIAREALEEAVPILEENLKKEARKVVVHEGESEMAESFRATAPKRTKTDAWIVNVTPKGTSKTKMYVRKSGKGKKKARRYPVSNALKAIWKEYGIPGRQPARPFIAAAVNKSRNQVMECMQDVYNRKVGQNGP